MPVDPKYSNLPWIAADEKDMYETEDLPEADQAVYAFDDPEIEKIKISIDDAKQVFKGKYLNADNIDFSDKIRPYVNTGYSLDTDEYILFPDGENSSETPLQRFQRLQHEVRDLLDDINKIQTMYTEDSANQKGKMLELSNEVDSLRSNLHRHKLKCVLGEALATNVEVDDELCNTDAREMFEDIQKYIASYKKGDTSDDVLTWERYYRSPLSKELDDTKMMNLDQRIQKLEAALGYGSQCSNLSFLSSEVATRSLIESSKALTSRCQPLKGGPTVDKLETRLLALQNKLQSVTEKRDLVSEADRQNKIAELFNLVQKWNNFGKDVDMIVKRLEDLHELHNQAMLFSDTISLIEKNQTDMKRSLLIHGDVLKKIEKDFDDNLQKIKSNVENVQSVVEKI